jgi:hypothetical protein
MLAFDGGRNGGELRGDALQLRLRLSSVEVRLQTLGIKCRNLRELCLRLLRQIGYPVSRLVIRQGALRRAKSLFGNRQLRLEEPDRAIGLMRDQVAFAIDKDVRVGVGDFGRGFGIRPLRCHRDDRCTGNRSNLNVSCQRARRNIET